VAPQLQPSAARSSVRADRRTPDIYDRCRSCSALDQLQPIGRTESEPDGIDSRDLQRVESPWLVTIVDRALNGLRRRRVRQIHPGVVSDRTNEHYRVSDHDPVRFPREAHALPMSRLERECASGMPVPTPTPLVDKNLAGPGRIVDAIHGCSGPIRATRPAQVHRILARGSAGGNGPPHRGAAMTGRMEQIAATREARCGRS
jgi:hypothetical protein